MHMIYEWKNKNKEKHNSDDKENTVTMYLSLF